MMASTEGRSKPKPTQRICTLWTHDETFSKEEVVFNAERFPELTILPRELMRIVAVNQSIVVRDFQTTAYTPSGEEQKDSDGERNRISAKAKASSARNRSNSITITLDENGVPIKGGRELDFKKTYVFVPKQMNPGLRSKYPNLQVSISETIARAFGFRNRMQVVVAPVDEDSHSASHVEISFRDVYLARADMWRLATHELCRRTVYSGQKILFMGTIKATVKKVYISGRITRSAYFSPSTKPIFRSESARYVLFIQMSKEMWDFDAEGSGEIMFNKVINGFLPELFKRWLTLNVRHLVTIILFTRLEYEEDLAFETHYNPLKSRPRPENPQRATKDFYRVVVSEMASGDWVNILYQLKKEFRVFLRDVSTMPFTPSNRQSRIGAGKYKKPECIIVGSPSNASKGNILEAINLASSQFSRDYIDRDLVRTGISVVVITAGTGVFEVDYNLLKLTTDNLIGSGIGIDLVCLSPMPLHSVPLFKYRSPRLFAQGASLVSFNEENAFQTQACDSGETPSEATPRQVQPRAEHYLRTRISDDEVRVGIQRTPYEFSPTFYSSKPGEWSYAMPHWIDISFWSGVADEWLGLFRTKGLRAVKSRGLAKARRFSPRCRMYELQMMGFMENELSTISIPYLAESPLYPWSLRKLNDASAGSLEVKEIPGQSFNTPSMTDKEREKLGVETMEWMDKYDNSIFNAVSKESGQEGEAISLMPRDPVRQEFQHPTYGESLLAVSFNSSRLSLGRSSKSSHKSCAPQSAQLRDDGLHYISSSGHSLRRINSEQFSFFPVMGRAQTLRQGSSQRTQGKASRQTSLRKHSLPAAVSGKLEAPQFQGTVEMTKGHCSLLTPDMPISMKGEMTEPSDRNGSGGPPTHPNAMAEMRPSGWLSKYVGFGSRSAAPKAIASAASSSGEVGPATLGAASVPGQQSSIKQLRALTRKPSGRISTPASQLERKDAETPSQPINIRSTRLIGDSSFPGPSVKQSLKGRSPKNTALQLPAEPKTGGSIFLLSGSKELLNQVGPKPDLSTSSEAIPRSISPTSAISPWLVLVNPCNPSKNDTNVASQFHRWQHVFPRPPKTSAIKWKSLCSPAAVPLTNDYFPTPHQLSTEYHESPYTIVRNDEDESAEVSKIREPLIRELISFRLSHGFQLIVGESVAEFTGGQESEIANVFAQDYMGQDGSVTFMSLCNTIHQLQCISNGEVEVKRFNRKPTMPLESSPGLDTPLIYRPTIRTALENEYETREIILQPPREEHNWNLIDGFLAGYHEEFSDILRFWRARFVLIPVDPPKTSNRRQLHLLAEDSEEEIRLEGIRKLTQIWQKYRYLPSEDRQFLAPSRKRKDPNPLAIEYQTRDPSAVVAAGPDPSLLTDGDTKGSGTQLFAESERYNTSNIDLQRLAHDLQGDKGIKMLDRRWHWRLHMNCFLGFDLTSWLLQNFNDIETREEAVELGNRLMDQGLFLHVQRKHRFRDGNFFYNLTDRYRAPRPAPESKPGWVWNRRPDKSVPSTPFSEISKNSPFPPLRNRSRPSTSHSNDSGERTPTKPSTPVKRICLSNVMRYDVDPRKRSYRPEHINLHYDRLHNPDNCYHIRIDWMNVTPKLIEDAIVMWAVAVEKFGLKLVEVPIAEASSITNVHPFRSPYIIKLAIRPSEAQLLQYYDANHLGAQTRMDRLVYHKALLRKFNFVLDMEAASSFPLGVEVTYSWGRPDYQYTQYIHKSGMLLAQITDEGHFLLLANRLYDSRSSVSKEAGKFERGEYERRGIGALYGTGNGPTLSDRRSPMSSPFTRAVPDSFVNSILEGGPSKELLTPEMLKDELEVFCHDEATLQSFYIEALNTLNEETLKPRESRTSLSPLTTPTLDSPIPTLGLPPSLAAREASPTSGLGSSLSAHRSSHFPSK